MARGQRVPALDNKPELAPYLGWIWNAFQQLSTCRSLGMGIGPIPWTSILTFAGWHGIGDEDDFEYFRCVIAEMDKIYIETTANKEKRKPGKGKGTKK